MSIRASGNGGLYFIEDRRMKKWILDGEGDSRSRSTSSVSYPLLLSPSKIPFE
jgi:hypothetical protein